MRTKRVANFPLSPRGRGRDPRSGRVRGLAQNDVPYGTSPLTFPLLRNGPLPLPRGERENIPGTRM
jgi:hypothetical protein